MRDKLTVRQFEVLKLLAQFKSSKEIGLVLGISIYAVDQRIRSAVIKLNASSRREAANLFRNWEENAASNLPDLSDYVIDPANAPE